jgi:hypothetical protein
MAGVVRALGRGGQRFVEEVVGWNRVTIRKGESELATGTNVEDRFADRGRKPAEYHLPELLEDIVWIVEPNTQTDPTFRSTRIYTPLTAKEVRKRLKQEGYRESQLPCERTIRNKLNFLDYSLKKVAKCKPLKKIEQTDAIFDEVHRINAEADSNPRQLRISLDTKAVVRIGEFSRGGKSRQEQKALDHDFGEAEKLVPFGIFVPQTKENFLWFSTSKVTADFMVDRLEELWPSLLQQCPQMDTLVINADNGPESNGRRKQWLQRLVEFSDKHKITIQLAYYPPYHSKYNPIERCWGVLENHWRGELLASINKTLGLARSMTYAGVKPVVKLVRKVYQNGVTLTDKALSKVEESLTRTSNLENWFITIFPNANLG